MSNRIVFTVGISGSGKSSWAREFIPANPSFKRISRDDLRLMLDCVAFDPKKEGFITEAQMCLIYMAASRGYNILVDATHLRPSYVKIILNELYHSGYSYTPEFKVFEVDVDECIKRDATRPQPVGEKVIRSQYEQFKQWKPDDCLPNIYPAPAYVY